MSCEPSDALVKYLFFFFFCLEAKMSNFPSSFMKKRKGKGALRNRKLYPALEDAIC